MSTNSTTFVDYSTPVVAAAWLNDVNRHTFTDIINVRDHGATGNGSTDDTTAITNAIAAVPTYGGAVFFPGGSYKVTSTITLPESRTIKLYGVGSNSDNNGFTATVIVKPNTFSGTVIVVNTDGSSIEDLAIQGVAGNSGDGIVVKAGRVVLRNVTVAAMGGDGIRIGTDAGGENCNLWLLDNCKTLSNGGNGVKVSEGAGALADANAGTCLHLDTMDNTLSGLFFNATQLNTIVGGAFQTNARYGIEFSQYAKYNTVFGGDCESNTIGQIRLDSGSTNNTIINNTINWSHISYADTSNDNFIVVLDRHRVASGITFPSVQVASSDVNTLDDYKEGTWTPDIVPGSSGTVTLTSPTDSMRYTKIGRVVYISGQLSVASVSSPVGDISINGLPYTSANTNGAISAISILGASLLTTTAFTALQAFINSNNTSVKVRGLQAGAQVSTMANNLQAGSTLVISGHYSV